MRSLLAAIVLAALSLSSAAAAAASSMNQPLSSSRAEDVMDLEAVRDTLHMLINNGNALTEDTMSGVSASYSGLVREYLDELNALLNNAKSPAEIYLVNQLTDMRVTRGILLQLQQMGVKATIELGAAMFDLLDGPSSRMLAPYLKTEAGLKNVNEMSSRTQSVANAIDNLLKDAGENLEDQLVSHAASMPDGAVKSFITDLTSTVMALQTVEIESDNDLHQTEQFSSEELQNLLAVLDNAIDKQTVKYITDEMRNGSKSAIARIDELLARDLASQKLIQILKAIRNCLE